MRPEPINIYQVIKEILQTARDNAYSQVNFIIIGKQIVEEEQKGEERAKYGTYLITELSSQLSDEFGKGFSKQSLWNMRQFYKAFPILSAVRRELSWTHYKMIIRLKDENARVWYMEESIKSNCSTRALDRQIGTQYYERQKRIKTEHSDFYIDLVVYNYILKCFVVIDLKRGKLTHQDVGQIDMYVRMFDDLEKSEDDNPTIGIILCTEKDNTVVKYLVIDDSDNLFVSKYQFYLPTVEELQEQIEKDILELNLKKDLDE